jgi:deoxyribonuclease-1
MRTCWVWAMLVALSLSGTAVLAQDGWDAVSVSDSVVTFGTVTTGEPDSVLITLTNSLTTGVEILQAAFEEDVFSTDLDGKVIPALGNLDFHIYFSTEQNVDYTDFLRIELDAGVRPLIVEVSAQGDYPGTYYDATQNLWGEELKDTLTAVIDDHNSLGYTLARDHMYGDIDNVDGWVECVYTGRTAFFNTRAGATENNFNCEHTWPQSFSDEAEPMKSDIFHLYPTDMTANSQRANLDFGIVVSQTWGVGGSKLGTDGEGQTVFEPRDVHKGNVARTHFYYIIRYDGNYNLYVDPAKMESHFRVWHESDPVDSAEQQRNEDIYSLQYNRNPFIDHPALADRISSFFGTALHEPEAEIAAAPAALDMGVMGLSTTAHAYIAVVNTGTDTLDVSSISSTDPDFVLNKAGMSLAPETYEYAKVTYTSGEVELTDSTLVVISSNDDDEGTLEIPVTIEVTDLSGIDDAGPAGTVLYQNRPNPFGRRTTIAFNLDRPAEIHLSIYDAEGRLVRRLLSGKVLSPGEHRVDFIAGDLPSGIYYYRLVAGGRVLARPMLVLKATHRP